MTILNQKYSVSYIGMSFFALFCMANVQVSIADETADSQKVPPRKKFFPRLPPEGDYAKLNFCIQSNKKTYRGGEPIFIRTSIRNDSSSDVSICAGRAPVNYLNANKINIDAKQRNVERTSDSRLREDKTENGADSYIAFSGFSFSWLLPGESRELEIRPLNAYYDLTRPGKYRITYYRRAVTWNQNIDPPLKSNTLEIEIESYPFMPHQLAEPGDFGGEPPFDEKEDKTVSDMK